MTNETRQRAIDALFRCRTFGGKYFPEVYVVGENIAFFRNQAKRLKDRLDHSFDRKHEVEVLTYEMAHYTRSGVRPTQKQLLEDVDWHVNQAGDLFDGQLYNPLKPNYNGNSFKSISKPARADRPRRRATAQPD